MDTPEKETEDRLKLEKQPVHDELVGEEDEDDVKEMVSEEEKEEEEEGSEEDVKEILTEEDEDEQSEESEESEEDLEDFKQLEAEDEDEEEETVEDDANNNTLKSTKSEKRLVNKPPDIDTSSTVVIITPPCDSGIESAGLESISFSTHSPGADSLGSILTSPPTPKLTAHELALLGSAHSFGETPKIDANTTPWFYKTTWKSIMRAQGGTPMWARKKPSKEIFIWLFVCLIVVVMLCIVIPVMWFKNHGDDEDESSGEELTDPLWTTDTIYTFNITTGKL